jgi:hypothetical protein
MPVLKGKELFSQIIVATVQRFIYIPRPVSLSGGIWDVTGFRSNADN